MSEEIVTRWFKDMHADGKVFGICRADFREKILLKEERWFLPTGTAWEETRAVSQWFFVSRDTLWEITREEAEERLPSRALSE